VLSNEEQLKLANDAANTAATSQATVREFSTTLVDSRAFGHMIL
jgi:hypothetical protein